MKIKFRTAFWIVAAALVVVLLVFAFRPQPVAVDVAKTVRGPMAVTVRDEGRTRVRNEYVVSAPVAGRLLRVDLKPGAHVHGGEPVARVRPAPPAFLDVRAQAEAEAAVDAAQAALDAAQAELARAEAEADLARAELRRIEALRARDLTSVEAFDRARVRAQVAEAARAMAAEGVQRREAELQAARARLTQPGSAPRATDSAATDSAATDSAATDSAATDSAATDSAVADAAVADAAVLEVPAPVTGRVLRVAQESEGVIAAGQEILTLGDPSELEVVVEMLSTDAVQVEPGDEVLIENYGRTEEPLRGRVRLVEPYGFTKISALGVEEQRVNVIVDFEGPPSEWSVLGHGFRVEAAVVVWREDDVLQAPVAALFRSGEDWAVFRVVEDRARLTPVEVGRENGRNAQILAGLEAGETVILYPGEQIADGVRVVRRSAE